LIVPWSGWSDGPSRGAMVLVMLEPVALAWILLLPVIAGSRIRWSPE
jgi:hypothetical protein